MPSLPTDNLYKFISISGILLLIFCGHLHWNTRQNLLQNIENLEAEVDVLSFQHNTLSDDLKKIEGSIYKQKTNSPIEDPKIKEQSKIQNEILVKAILLKGKLKSIRRVAKDSENLFFFSTFIGIIGVFLSILGFCNWYYKIQVHLDKKIIVH
jgi:hypothetical protein